MVTINMFISLDEDKKKWMDFKSSLMSKNNSFLLKKNFSSSLAIKYLNNKIPHYLLIGKYGEIIHNDAPRPSDPSLKQLIEKYL